MLFRKIDGIQQSNVVVIDNDLLAPGLGSNIVLVGRGSVLVELHGKNDLAPRCHSSK
ncbi:hypothetical protein X767_11540 [Mesorhizobium sp. LSJC264A00]|nr:hypothetical protein X767_11540 [Mesorhizobium sp. LSJC264A00]